MPDNAGPSINPAKREAILTRLREREASEARETHADTSTSEASDTLLKTMLANLRANNADPEAYERWQEQRNAHARAVPMGTPIPKAPALNPDGSLKG